MTTKIIGSKFENHPTVDVFDMFERDKGGRIILSEQAKVDRAKIAAKHGFIVDPVSGQGFWQVRSSYTVPQEKK